MNDNDTYVAFIPGGGWMIEQRNADGGTSTQPVVGWGLDRTGGVTAFTTDRDGLVTRVHDDVDENKRVFHPDSHYTSAEKAARSCSNCWWPVTPVDAHHGACCKCGHQLASTEKQLLLDGVRPSRSEW